MKNSVKFATLAALTAATMSLPAAAEQAKAGPQDCQPKASTSKCGAKSVPAAKGKCSPKATQRKASGAAATCGAKCAPKCAAKS